MDDITPDTTFTEARNAALTVCLQNLGKLLDAFEFPNYDPIYVQDHERRFSLTLGKSICHRGEWDTEYQIVTFSFDELANPAFDIIQMAKTRWADARVAATRAYQLAEEKRLADEIKSKRENEAKEAAQREVNERARLRELLARYPDEGKASLLGQSGA